MVSICPFYPLWLCNLLLYGRISKQVCIQKMSTMCSVTYEKLLQLLLLLPLLINYYRVFRLTGRANKMIEDISPLRNF